jgi:SRSO17 transposase
MAARYAWRKTPWLDECQVAPEMFAQVIPRLYTFMKPFVTIFHGQGDDQHAKTSVCGLLSDIEPKHSEALASRFGPSRLPLQGCMGWQEWADEPLRQELRRQVKTPWGQGEGVWVCDPSGLPTSGGESVGVARQWCGRLGKVDHCHGAMYLGYVSRQGHTWVDTRRSRPKAWTKHPARLDKAGVPPGSRGYRTRHPWALEMLATNGAGLPHSGIAGDDARGRPSGLRRRLAA